MAEEGIAVKLSHKTAIVTDGARGIGAAICGRYPAEGARVDGGNWMR